MTAKYGEETIVRHMTRVLLVVSAVTAAACGEPPRAAPEPVADMLFMSSSSGVSVIEAGSGEVSESTPGSIVTSSDWSTVVNAKRANSNTSVVASDPSTGVERWRTELKGRLYPKLLSTEGDLAVLSPVREEHYASGRTSTEMVIAGSGMIRPRRIVLEGNYEPEAFSTDGEHLFVIKYLPAPKPKKYQVRQLDIGTGTVKPVFTPHDELQRPMGGSARIQVASPDGRRLYTLYTVGGDKGYAFIHVLSLDKMWAHCIALPREFARSASDASALTISPDGKSLYVANHAANEVAEVDTQALQVTRSNFVQFEGGFGMRAAHDHDRTIYLGGGKDLASVDTDSLELKNKWQLEERVSGIQAGDEGKKVYVGLKREVMVLDGETGETLEEFDPDGVGRIGDLGTGMRWVGDTFLKCAC